MQVITDIRVPVLSPKPRALTIGNFDGLHRGHLFLLKQARSLLPPEGSLLVYTFINHPSHVLSHLPPILSIYTLEHRLKILQENQVDCTILIPFTKELAQTPFDQFLKELKNTLEFTYLVLGKGASFGKDKQGNEANIRQCAKELGFEVEYLSKLQLDNENLSSGHIRTLISQGAFSEAEQCLGRPYSIYAPIFLQNEPYMQLYQHCLPPSATYPIQVAIEDKIYSGRAHVDRTSQRIYISINEDLSMHRTMQSELFFN